MSVHRFPPNFQMAFQLRCTHDPVHNNVDSLFIILIIIWKYVLLFVLPSRTFALLRCQNMIAKILFTVISLSFLFNYFIRQWFTFFPIDINIRINLLNSSHALLAVRCSCSCSCSCSLFTNSVGRNSVFVWSWAVRSRYLLLRRHELLTGCLPLVCFD